MLNLNYSYLIHWQQVLVVQEKYCSPTFANFWKIPTGFIVEVRGFNPDSSSCLNVLDLKILFLFLFIWLFWFFFYIDQKEEIYTGVTREVKEETGVSIFCQAFLLL